MKYSKYDNSQFMQVFLSEYFQFYGGSIYTCYIQIKI